MAWDGTNFFAVWGRDDLANGKDVYGARIAPSGAVLDPSGIAIATGFARQSSPRVAWGGSMFFVVWNAYDNIAGTRVTPGGTVLDREGIVLASDNWAPVPVWDGQNFLVAWDSWSWSTNIVGIRVSESGAISL